MVPNITCSAPGSSECHRSELDAASCTFKVGSELGESPMKHRIYAGQLIRTNTRTSELIWSTTAKRLCSSARVDTSEKHVRMLRCVKINQIQ